MVNFISGYQIEINLRINLKSFKLGINKFNLICNICKTCKTISRKFDLHKEINA